MNSKSTAPTLSPSVKQSVRRAWRAALIVSGVIGSALQVQPDLAHASDVPDLNPAARHLMMEEYEARSQRSTRFLLEETEARAKGKILVTGQAGETQLFKRVKIMRCEIEVASAGLFASQTFRPQRSRCFNPIFFDLNVETEVPEGSYLVGFENMLQPGLVHVREGELTRLDLQRVSVPRELQRSETPIKVFRDLNHPAEQRKLMWATFASGERFFSVAEYDFGDHYLRRFPLTDAVPNPSYKICERERRPELSLRADRLCRVWNLRHAFAVNELFDLRANGTGTQFSVQSPGDAFPIRLLKQLVAAPMNGQQSLALLPGAYVMEGSVGGKVVRRLIRTPDLDSLEASAYGIPLDVQMSEVAELLERAATEVRERRNRQLSGPTNATNEAPTADGDPDDDDQSLGLSCQNTRLWKTEVRAWCRSDQTTGCARAQAKFCEPLTEIR